MYAPFVTIRPILASYIDPDLVLYRQVMQFTEEEIDWDREAAMQFYKDMYGLDFTSIEPNDQGQRIWEMQHLNLTRVPTTIHLFSIAGR